MASFVKDIDTFINPKNDEETQTQSVQNILSNLGTSSHSLEHIVGKMGPYLTNGDSKVRCRAALLLAKLLNECPNLTLTEKTVEHLVKFFCSRMEDYPSLHPCLQALQGLVSHHTATVISVNGSALICKAVLTELTLPSLAQTIRSTALTLTETLIVAPGGASSLLPASSGFVAALADSLQGEKDPRCLLIGLRCFNHIETMGFELNAELVEKIFDAAACYFPVCFTPPANDPHHITKEMLVDALDRVLCGHQGLLAHLFPFLMDKISSSSKDDQIASIQTLAKFLQRWGFVGPPSASYLQLLSEHLFEEITTSSEGDLVEAFLGGLCRITAAVARHEQTQGGSFWAKFGSPLLSNSVSGLKGQPAGSLAGRRCAKILESLAAGSAFSLRKAAGAAIPSLVQQHKGGTTESERTAALAALAGLARAIDPKSDFSGTDEGPPLSPFAESMLDAFMDGLTVHADYEQRIDAINGLRSLVVRPPVPLLQPQQVTSVIQKLTDIILEIQGKSVSIELSNACLGALRSIALKENEAYLDMILQITVVGLIKRVSGLFDEKNQEALMENISLPLHALCELSAHPGILKVAIPDLLFTIVVKEGRPQDFGLQNKRMQPPVLWAIAHMLEVEDTSCSSPQNQHSLQWFMEGEAKVSSQNLFCSTPRSRSVSKNRMRSSSLSSCGSRSSQGQLSLGLDDLILAIINEAETCVESEDLFGALPPTAKITQLCLQNVEEGPQSIFARNILGRLMEAPSADGTSPHPAVFVIFGAVTATLALDSQIFQDQEFTEACISWTLSSLKRGRGGTAACQSLGALANKLPQGELLNCLLKLTVQGDLNQVAKGGQATISWENIQLALDCLLWVAKGIIMRGRPQEAYNAVLDTLCELATSKDPDLADLSCQAAKGFGVVIQPCKEALNDSCHTNVAPLWKQRFYAQSIPRLLEASQDKESTSAPLLAIANLAAGLPHAVLQEDLETLTPAIVQALTSEDFTLRSTALETLKTLMDSSVDVISYHLSSIIPTVLDLSISTLSGKASVRYLALQCLHKMTKIPFSRLKPFKTKVLKQLQQVLDDPKKIIRQMAVQVRNEWATVGVVV